METETYEIKICINCAMLIENAVVEDLGDLPDGVSRDHDSAILYNWPGDDASENPASRLAESIEYNWPSNVWTLAMGDHTTNFSSSACQTCDTRLGGTRLQAFAMYNENKNTEEAVKGRLEANDSVWFTVDGHPFHEEDS